MSNPIIVWLRNDLRLHDHPALFEASTKGTVIPLYIYDDNERQSLGAAKKWWLHHSLQSFELSMEKLGANIIIKHGNPELIIQELIEETNASGLFYNRCYEPTIYERDQQLNTYLYKEYQIDIQTFEGTLILPPWTVRRNGLDPYKVFTAYYRAFQQYDVPKPYPIVKELISYDHSLPSLSVNDLNLLPKVNWTRGMEQFWDVSEQAAISRFESFINDDIPYYQQERDLPAKDITSHLSPYLTAGQISVRTIFHSLEKMMSQLEITDVEPFTRQLVWREFAYHQLFHFPHTVTEPLNEKFAKFKWEANDELFKAWIKGKTGYPLIDAGMRELWETGFMHNRVRMVVASFLVKHLLIPWQNGADWFSDTLVDADIANNTMGWQWVSGCGADAAPYFRIFNPMIQSEKFDPNADYIRKWIPELKDVQLKNIHDPFRSPIPNNPAPIVDHKQARNRALEKYNEIK